jgi:hypothetical protein
VTEAVVGLFSKQIEVGHAVEDLYEKESDRGLMIISQDQIIRDPSDLDPDQLLAEDAGTMGVTDIGEVDMTTSMLIPDIAARIPAKVINQVGVLRLQESLTDMGVDIEDANFYAESVKHGGILLIVEAEEDQESTVDVILQEADAVKLET